MKSSIQTTSTSNRLIRSLRSQYTILKARYSGQTYRRNFQLDSIQNTHFEKCARQILDLQSRSYPVNQIQFLTFVFDLFGAHTYPAMLGSPKCWEMYLRWNAHQSTGTVSDATLDDEYEMLEFLARTREETCDATFAALRGAGLFSQAFLSAYEPK